MGTHMQSKIYIHHADGSERLRAIKRVLWVILLLNLAVAVAKYGYGVFTQTTSMQADGIHSLFDSAGNIVGLIGMSIASRPADIGHPYGHMKFETYASAAIGILLLFAAYNIGSTAVLNLINGTANPQVTGISFAVMCITLCINICVTTWEHRAGKRLKSAILTADAHHTLSDVLVSVSVIVGLVFVRMGYTIVDPIMSLVVAVAILYTAYEVFKQANSTLADKARIPSKDIIACVQQVSQASDCHEVRTRGSEAEVYVDLHLLVDPEMSVHDAHEVAERVETRIKEEFEQVKDVMVHIEPDDDEQHRQATGTPL